MRSSFSTPMPPMADSRVSGPGVLMAFTVNERAAGEPGVVDAAVVDHGKSRFC